MEPETVLKEFGLTDTETKVYLTLLKLGEATVPEIVKKVKVYKSNAYNALESLEKKGLVAHVKKDYRQFYSALNPEKLFGILESKKESLDSIFPILQEYYGSKKGAREVNILSGKEGIKTLFKDIENVGDNILIVGSALQLFSLMQHYPVQLMKKLECRKAVLKAVLVDRTEVRARVSEIQKSAQIGEVKYYPEKYFSPVAFITYGDRLIMGLWEDDPLVIWIKDEHIAKTFRNYFEMIWRSAKK